MSTASIDGLTLAVSQSGGSGGTLRLPLVLEPDDLSLILSRAAELVEAEEPEDFCSLLTGIREVLETTEPGIWNDGLATLLRAVADLARESWNRRRVHINSDALSAFVNCSVAVEPILPLPDLRKSLDQAEQTLAGLRSCVDQFSDIDELAECGRLLRLVQQNEPRILRATGLADRFESHLAPLLDALEAQLLGITVDDDDLRTHADLCGSASTAINMLAPLAPMTQVRALELSKSLAARSKQLNEKAVEFEDPEPDEDYNGSHRGEAFDIKALFEDL